MLKFLSISLLQCLFLSGAQVFLKLALERMEKFSLTCGFFRDLLLNWPLAVSGVMFVSATALWFYILRNFPFSLAYPVTSIAYIFGMLAALWIFKEPIPLTRWIGVGLIVAGVFFMVKQ